MNGQMKGRYSAGALKTTCNKWLSMVTRGWGTLKYDPTTRVGKHGNSARGGKKEENHDEFAASRVVATRVTGTIWALRGLAGALGGGGGVRAASRRSWTHIAHEITMSYNYET